MIVSHRWRFIFIKTRKTAGTSLELALATICGPDDIITPVAEQDEPLRRTLGAIGPQHCEVPEERWTLAQRLKAALGARAPRFRNHMSARAARRALSADVWNGYYKFAFERNPWEKAVSAYHWEHPEEPRPTLDEFVASRRLIAYRNSPLYRDRDGTLLVDHVARYEDLLAEVERLRVRLGLPALPELPRAKGAFRGDRRPACERLSPASRARVARLFADEVAAFGYRCG